MVRRSLGKDCTQARKMFDLGAIRNILNSRCTKSSFINIDVESTAGHLRISRGVTNKDFSTNQFMGPKVEGYSSEMF